MTGHEHDGCIAAEIGEAFLEIEAAYDRQPDVEDEAAGLGENIAVEQLGGRGGETDIITNRTQQTADRSADGGFVVDDDDQRCFHHPRFAPPRCARDATR